MRLFSKAFVTLICAVLFLSRTSLAASSIQLIPGDERVASICKQEISIIYCSDREATSAIARCILKLPNRGLGGTTACEMLGGDACIKAQASNLPCGNAGTRPCPSGYNESKKQPSELSLSASGVKLMRINEGFKTNVYNDNAGNCTVGVGHLIHSGKCNGDQTERPFLSGISESAAEEIFRTDSKKTTDDVRSIVKVPLTQAQFDVIFSMVFQYGRGTISKSSFLLAVNNGDWDLARQKLKLYTKIKDPITKKFVASSGLENRRTRESSLLNGDCSALGETP